MKDKYILLGTAGLRCKTEGGRMLSRYPMAPPPQTRPRPTMSPTVSTLPTLPPRLLLILDEWHHCHCRPSGRKPGDALSFSFSFLPFLSPPFHHMLLFRPKCTLNTFPFPAPLSKLPAALTLLLLPSLTSPRAPAARRQQAFPGAQDAFPGPSAFFSFSNVCQQRNG